MDDEKRGGRIESLVARDVFGDVGGVSGHPGEEDYYFGWCGGFEGWIVVALNEFDL